MAESSHSEINGITASANGLTTDQAGVVVFDSHDLDIERNTVSANGDIGFFMIGVDDSRIQRNTMARNPEASLVLEGSGNDLSRNRATEGGDGLGVDGDGNTVARNYISGAQCPDLECGFGVIIGSGSGNLVERNTVVRAHSAGIRIGSPDPEAPPPVGTTVSRNLVESSDVDGVLVGSTALDTLLERNTATGSGDDGFDIQSAATTLTRNGAFDNSDLGIEAVPGVTDGGHNRARGNGNPAQCTNVACR
jgi:parallel beta-helix repeat protein